MGSESTRQYEIDPALVDLAASNAALRDLLQALLSSASEPTPNADAAEAITAATARSSALLRDLDARLGTLRVTATGEVA